MVVQSVFRGATLENDCPALVEFMQQMENINGTQCYGEEEKWKPELKVAGGFSPAAWDAF